MLGSVRLATMALGWGDPHGEQFDPWLGEVKAAGYEGVSGFAEFGWKEYIDQPDLFRKHLDENGLGLASVDAALAADFDFYRRVCEFICNAGGRHLVLFGGAGSAPGDAAAIGGLLNRIGEIALSYGISAAYHNHTGTAGETLADMDRLLAQTDPAKFAVMLDVGHATMDFSELPVERRAIVFLQKYWERLDLIEFKDWSPSTLLDTPVGDGESDWTAIFGFLEAKDYRGWIVVEQNFGESENRIGSPFDCALRSREFIERSSAQKGGSGG